MNQKAMMRQLQQMQAAMAQAQQELAEAEVTGQAGNGLVSVTCTGAGEWRSVRIDPKLIEEVYYGIVSPPADGPNVSREALFDAGLPSSIACTTVNRYCASSAEAAAGIAGKIPGAIF